MTEQGLTSRNYGRINRAAVNVLRQNGWKALYNGAGGVDIVTNNAMRRINQAVTVRARNNAIERAANGQSAG